MTATRPICPDCRSSNTELIGRLPDGQVFAGRTLDQPVQGGALFHCKGCWLKFRSPAPSESFRAAGYDNSLTQAWSDEATVRADWRLIVTLVHQQAITSPRVLDIGCYTGGLLRALGEGIKKAGVEPNRAAAQFASREVGAEVWHSLEDIPADKQFDFIIATDVIEHVDRPAVFVQTMFSKLAPGGSVILTTGDGDAPLASLFGANWWYWFTVEHISFISKKWIELFCQTTGATSDHVIHFSYLQLTPAVRLSHLLQTLLYGLTGSFYLGAVRLAYQLTKRRWPVFPRGAGVTADHLLVMLAPSRNAMSIDPAARNPTENIVLESEQARPTLKLMGRL
jgi:2-polyprenyl-3-methyl-5-hydroxy-6-metoxy-1,4-benzoquinol methylase